MSKRWCLWGLVTLLELGACGPAIDKSGFTDVTIINHGKTFTDRVYNHQTYAWDQAALGEVAALGPELETTTQVVVVGSEPRELIVFEFPFSEDLTPGSGAPWIAPVAVKQANVGTPVEHAGVTRTVPMAVLSARLIDHGKCWVELPLLGEGAIFDQLDAALLAKAQDGRTATLTKAAFQASFMQPPGATSRENDDGFSLRVEYAISKYIWTGDLGFEATYAVRTQDGFLALEAIGDVVAELTDTTTLTEAMRSDLADLRAQLRTELPAQFRESALLTAGTELIGSCTPGPAGDAYCADGGPGLVSVAYHVAGPSKAEADALVARLHPESFICRATDPAAPTEGRCFYRPWFKRVSVLPDHLELVWYDANEPPSADYTIARKLSPAKAGTCDHDYRAYGPIELPRFLR